ncbi:hypothetical protein F2Q69_00056944 [Brassica cretica]|uniref:Uncharacterized protein n=1 Tax=Brassica cretica TaxID=69181 RepID=A0A8S9N1J3_BRACR|nr:hypothetical protein F2Q69_00056944 [Brassica cretica]
MICNNVMTWIQELQTQLSHKSEDGTSISLSTLELDKIFEKAIPKKEHITELRSITDIQMAISKVGSVAADNGKFLVVGNMVVARALEIRHQALGINTQPNPEEQVGLKQRTKNKQSGSTK